MDILVIGVSSIFTRRVLPGLLSLKCVGKIHLASRGSVIDVDIPESHRGKIFSGYQAALDNTKPCLAYISLPNYLHAEWTQKALIAGFHVVVEKPAFLEIGQAKNILELAKKNNLCIAESIVWPFNPQIKTAIDFFSENDVTPKSIQAIFSFPPLQKPNFRNFLEMGGGSFNDLVAYAVTPGRIFFQDDPITVVVNSLSFNRETQADTSFVITMTYSGGRSFQGLFGFDTEYKNSLSIISSRISTVIEPAFTLGNACSLEINVRKDSKLYALQISPSDGFSAFFQAVIESIEMGEWMKWNEVLMRDAAVMHLAKQSMRR
jgi:predicted dehydrogenase